MSEKPKEFWVAPKLYTPADPVEAEYYVAYDMEGEPNRLEIHVIEYSAYKELERKLGVAEDHFKKIRDARLNNPNQEMGDLLLYKSEVAIEALAQIGEEGE